MKAAEHLDALHDALFKYELALTSLACAVALSSASVEYRAETLARASRDIPVFRDEILRLLRGLPCDHVADAFAREIAKGAADA